MNGFLLRLLVGILVVSSSAIHSGCGVVGFNVEIIATGGSGGSDRAEVTIEVSGEVHTEEVSIFDQCLIVPICGLELCVGEFPLAGMASVTCEDPVLAEWPDDATLVSATWIAPQLAASGQILVEPAENYTIPASFGTLVTDPGSSAYVLRLDAENLGPADFELSFTFDWDSDTNPMPCVKALAVTTIDVLPLGSGDRFIIPTEFLGVDFTAITQPDPHVFCVDAGVELEAETWSNLKQRYGR